MRCKLEAVSQEVSKSCELAIQKRDALEVDLMKEREQRQANEKQQSDLKASKVYESCTHALEGAHSINQSGRCKGCGDWGSSTGRMNNTLSVAFDATIL